ncbi:hypothetical protein D3C85_1426800 [compost metagenome]
MPRIHQHPQPGDDQQQAGDPWRLPGVVMARYRAHGMPRLAQQQGQIQEQCRQQDHTVGAGQFFIPRQYEHQQAGADHQRNVQAHELP